MEKSKTHMHGGAHEATFLSYTAGYVISIILTLVAFALVGIHGTFSHEFLTIAIVTLAIVQLMVQAIFFLHLSTRSSARWNLVVFVFAVLIVITVVGGSLWIMNNLNYNMTNAELQVYMNNQN